MAINAESRQTLLGMGGQHGGQIYRAGAFGCIQTPDGFDGVAIHVHGFGAIAPAGGYGQGDGNTLTAELFLTGGGFRHTADGGVGDDYAHRLAVGVAQILLKQFCGGLCHVHGLVFQALAHLQGAAAAIDDGADADDGVTADIPVLFHLSKSSLLVICF